MATCSASKISQSSSVLKGVAERQGITLAQLAIAWVLANPAVDVAIVGAHRPDHLEQTAAAGDVHLTPELLGETLQIMREAVAHWRASPRGYALSLMPHSSTDQVHSIAYPSGHRTDVFQQLGRDQIKRLQTLFCATEHYRAFACRDQGRGTLSGLLSGEP